MPMLGQLSLIVALLCAVLTPITLLLGFALGRRAAKKGSAQAGTGRPLHEKLTNVGYLLTFGSALFLTICIAVLIYCFFAGDYTIAYVAHNHSSNTTGLSWLFKLSGVWAGREGSLLFWAWLISLFASYVAARRMTVTDELSNVALAIMGLVLAAFTCVCVFSSDNNPFGATEAIHLTADGQLTGAAMAWGMNVLLEHWAMAIHPPTLFIGYAGMTVPFAYALAALIVNDPSRAWVDLCGRITVFSWLFLGLGIGLGAVWAYVVLGWGGYWGWDAVENASLLAWLVGVALLHSFTVYRKRDGFKLWAVMCSCLCFAFVVLGTFITRSGLISESVHAFDKVDVVSIGFFLGLIIVSILAGLIGIIVRRNSFKSNGELESLVSRNAAYYFNNVIMVFSAIVLAYLTMTSVFPEWMPLGGMTVSTGTYDAIARPLGILYLLLLAVCPLLSWRKTSGKDFLRLIKAPAIGAIIVFALLMLEFVVNLHPIYVDTLNAGGKAAADLMAYGPAWYYFALTIIGFAVASILFMNTLFLFVRGISERKKNKEKGTGTALLHLFTRSAKRTGGYLTHLGLAFVLVGLIGSSMYVADASVNMPDTEGATIVDGTYTFTYRGIEEQPLDNGSELYVTTFDVSDAKGNKLGTVTPSLQYVAFTQQQKLNASVIGLPLHDVFVVFQGYNADDGSLSIDVKINPLISFVWIGFGIMMIGTLATFIPPRKRKKQDEGDGGQGDDDTQDDAEEQDDTDTHNEAEAFDGESAADTSEHGSPVSSIRA